MQIVFIVKEKTAIASKRAAKQNKKKSQWEKTLTTSTSERTQHSTQLVTKQFIMIVVCACECVQVCVYLGLSAYIYYIRNAERTRIVNNDGLIALQRECTVTAFIAWHFSLLFVPFILMCVCVCF